MNISVESILSALGTGLPVLIGHFAAVAILLVAGVTLYLRMTPHDEMALAAKGNTAGGLSFAGAVIALAIPLAATLATNEFVADILIWGVIALALQLLAYLFASRLIPDLSARIEEGNVASATMLVGVQIGVALLNAAAMAG